MSEYFAGGHLRFVNGEWRDDNGDAIGISRVRHGRWIGKNSPYDVNIHVCSICEEQVSILGNKLRYCPNCGAKMDGGDGNITMA